MALKKKAYERREKRTDIHHSMEDLLKEDVQIGHSTINRIVASTALSIGGKYWEMRKSLQTMAERGQEYTVEGGADYILRTANYTDLMRAIQNFKSKDRAIVRRSKRYAKDFLSKVSKRQLKQYPLAPKICRYIFD